MRSFCYPAVQRRPVRPCKLFELPFATNWLARTAVIRLQTSCKPISRSCSWTDGPARGCAGWELLRWATSLSWTWSLCPRCGIAVRSRGGGCAKHNNGCGNVLNRATRRRKRCHGLVFEVFSRRWERPSHRLGQQAIRQETLSERLRPRAAIARLAETSIAAVGPLWINRPKIDWSVASRARHSHRVCGPSSCGRLLPCHFGVEDATIRRGGPHAAVPVAAALFFLDAQTRYSITMALGVGRAPILGFARHLPELASHLLIPGSRSSTIVTDRHSS